MSEVYVDKHGVAHDDEGNSWATPGYPRSVHKGMREKRKAGGPTKSWVRPKRTQDIIGALQRALVKSPGNVALVAALRVVDSGKSLSRNDMVKIRREMSKVGMRKEAGLFEGMEAILKRLEEKIDDKTLDDKTRLIRLIYKKFSPSDKRKVGSSHKVVLTGTAAAALGVEGYSSVLLQDLSIKELNILAGLLKVKGVSESSESYTGRGTHIRNDLEEKFPREYARWLKTHKEACDAEKKFFAGKGREYFEMANRLHADAYDIYQEMKKKAGW